MSKHDEHIKNLKEDLKLATNPKVKRVLKEKIKKLEDSDGVKK